MCDLFSDWWRSCLTRPFSLVGKDSPLNHSLKCSEIGKPHSKRQQKREPGGENHRSCHSMGCKSISKAKCWYREFPVALNSSMTNLGRGSQFFCCCYVQDRQKCERLCERMAYTAVQHRWNFRQFIGCFRVIASDGKANPSIRTWGRCIIFWELLRPFVCGLCWRTVEVLRILTTSLMGILAVSVFFSSAGWISDSYNAKNNSVVQ